MFINPMIGGIADNEIGRKNFDRVIVRAVLNPDGTKDAEFYSWSAAGFQPMSRAQMDFLIEVYAVVALEFFDTHKLLK